MKKREYKIRKRQNPMRPRLRRLSRMASFHSTGGVVGRGQGWIDSGYDHVERRGQPKQWNIHFEYHFEYLKD